MGRPVSLSASIVSWLCCSYLWAAVTPFIIGFTWRFPIEKPNLPRNLALHLVTGAIFASGLLFAYVFVREAVMGGAPEPFSPWQIFQNVFVVNVHSNFLFYCATVGLSQTYD